MDSRTAALPAGAESPILGPLMVRRTAAVWLVLGLGACFTGNFLNGQPCTDDAECGPSLKCEQGFCGGPPPSDSTTSSTFGMSTTTVTPTTTGTETSTGVMSTSGTSTGDPTTGVMSTSDGTTGPTCGYGRCTDIDLVVVVDNSPSMIDKSNTLLSALLSFQKFIQPEITQACSVHLGVTTTDPAYQFNPAPCQVAGAMVQRDFDGNECITAEGHPYATLEDLDEVAPLLCLIRVGSNGSVDERPIESTFQLFNSTLNDPSGCNEGFVRPDAQMLIVYVTDEDDDDNDAQGNSGSIQTSTIWHDGLLVLKPQEDLMLIGLLGDDDQMATACPWDPFNPPPDGGGAEASPKLKEFLASFPPENTVVGSICQPELPNVYDTLMQEVQMKLRAMCEV